MSFYSLVVCTLALLFPTNAQASNDHHLNGVNPAVTAVVLNAPKYLQRTPECPVLDRIDVTEGVRPAERQAHLVASGNSQTMHSRHLTGDAVDLVPIVNGTQAWDHLACIHVVARTMHSSARELGVDIEWGAAWNRSLTRYPSIEAAHIDYLEEHQRRGTTPFIDAYHFQLRGR